MLLPIGLICLISLVCLIQPISKIYYPTQYYQICILFFFLYEMPLFTFFCIFATYEESKCFIALPRMWADIYSGEVMEYVNKEKGLYGETVSKIMADASGRVWIATDDGVCLYNGMKITAFPIPGDGENHNYTYDLTIHGSKAIYAATRQGVFRMRPEDNGFSRVFPSIKRAETVLSAKGQLFVGNRDGLHICRDGQVRTITVGSTPLGIENGVRDIREETDGGIWFISRYALNRYDVKTAKVKSYNLQPMLPPRAALSHLAVWKSHATLTPLAKQDCPLWLQYD